jgi:hypothetical protein
VPLDSYVPLVFEAVDDVDAVNMAVGVAEGVAVGSDEAVTVDVTSDVPLRVWDGVSEPVSVSEALPVIELDASATEIDRVSDDELDGDKVFVPVRPMAVGVSESDGVPEGLSVAESEDVNPSLLGEPVSV